MKKKTCCKNGSMRLLMPCFTVIFLRKWIGKEVEKKGEMETYSERMNLQKQIAALPL